MKLQNILTEVKSGPFNSKMVGKRVKLYGTDQFGNGKYDGEEGEVVRAEREHTFSQMVPFIVIYAVELDDGSKVNIRRENTRKVK